MQENKPLLYFRESAESLLRLTLLTALCQCLKTNYKGLTEGIHSYYLPIGSSGMYSLPAAEDMSTYDYQKRTFFSVNAISQCRRSIRQFFT